MHRFNLQKLYADLKVKVTEEPRVPRHSAVTKHPNLTEDGAECRGILYHLLNSKGDRGTVPCHPVIVSISRGRGAGW